MRNEINEESLHSYDDNTVARLRRLKIQQNIIQKSVKHLLSKCDVLNEPITNNNSRMELKKYFNKIKGNFIDIKNLFEEIKLSADTCKIKSDIDEIRKDVLLLETKIREFKDFLRRELDILRSQEETLNETVSKNLDKKDKVVFPDHYKIIVQSPVKAIIDSPFKYNEVQQFQEFMSKCPNRYGGWNEYNHNIFVQIWNAHYDNSTFKKNMSGAENDIVLHPSFINEVLHKIPGIKENDIITHSHWYTQYLRLYTCQQNALNKWKDNRRKIKNKDKHFQNRCRNKARRLENVKQEKEKTETNRQGPAACIVLSKMNIPAQINVHTEGVSIVKSSENISYDTCDVKKTIQSNLMKPTQQWINRCGEKKETTNCNHNVDDLKKLGVPKWRNIITK